MTTRKIIGGATISDDDPLAVSLDAASRAALENITVDALTVADGANVVEGATADAAATAGGTGTLSAKLRRLTAQIAAQLPAALGQGTMAQSLTVVVASDQSAVKTRGGATAAALTNVASSASSVAILALNAARIGATIYNDSTAILYLKFGATASATSYTVQLGPSDYFETPFGYSGQIDGIWVSANGNARVTELS